jgi:hypothetical protein
MSTPPVHLERNLVENTHLFRDIRKRDYRTTDIAVAASRSHSYPDQTLRPGPVPGARARTSRALPN